MWVRVDDQLHSHPKVRAAWIACDASLGLHLLALSYAGCFLTDGLVSEAFVALNLPQAGRRRKAITALVDAGLWHPVEGGWHIHDFLNYNESRDKILSRRAADSRRKRNGIGVEA